MNARRNYLLLILVGINNGMIPVLIGSTLYIWLKESGLSLTSIGIYGLAHLPFAFKFLISALLEYLSYKKFISYKNILLFSLITSAAAIYCLPLAIANTKLLFILCMLISLALTIAKLISQALQKTLFSEDKLVVVINVLTISFKIGILIAGSLALYLSQFVTWSKLYSVFASIIFLICILIAALFPKNLFSLTVDEVEHLSTWQKIIRPFTHLSQIPQISLILLLMFFYRAPDHLITHYFDLFYLHVGLSKTNVAFGYKLYGIILASLGGLICIKFIRHYSFNFNLNLALMLHMLSYGLIYWFSLGSTPLWAFYLCVTIEEFTRGMTMIIFWSFQTYISNRRHVLVQLALFTGLDSLSSALLGSAGGSLIDQFGYSNFLLIVIMSFIPAFIIIKFLSTQIKPAATG